MGVTKVVTYSALSELRRDVALAFGELLWLRTAQTRVRHASGVPVADFAVHRGGPGMIQLDTLAKVHLELLRIANDK